MGAFVIVSIVKKNCKVNTPLSLHMTEGLNYTSVQRLKDFAPLSVPMRY